MTFDKQTILKLLALFGLIATVLLLVSFQFLFAIVLAIVALVSWFLSKQDTSA